MHVDLAYPEWVEATITGSSPPVQLVQLHRDPDTKAFTVFVRFPPGWARTDAGHYEVTEEVVFLEGSLRLSGEEYGPGDYAWLPAHYTREGSVSPDGALALAWFSGRNHWNLGVSTESERARGEYVRARLDGESTTASLLGRAHALREGSERSAFVAETIAAGEPAPATVELFALDARRWARASKGEPLPELEGSVYSRTESV